MYKYRRMFLEITNACNWHCEFCPITGMTRKKGFMDKEFAKDIVTQIHENKLSGEIMLHVMGEPLLHKDVKDIYSFIIGKEIKIWLNTNASLLKDDEVEYFVKTCNGTISISFRMPSEFLFLKKDSEGINFEAYKARIKNIIKSVFDSGSNMELSIQMFDYYPLDRFILPDKYAVYARKKEIDDVTSELADFCKTLNPSVRQHVSGNKYYILENVYIIKSRIMSLWTSNNEKEKIYPGIFGTCNGLTKEFGVLWDGSVTACCVDFDGKNTIGNLHNNSLSEILSSEAAVNFRRSIENHTPPTKFCKECMGSSNLLLYVYKQGRGLMKKISRPRNSEKCV